MKMIQTIKRVNNKNWRSKILALALAVLLAWLILRPAWPFRAMLGDGLQLVFEAGGFVYERVPYLSSYFGDRQAIVEENQTLSLEVLNLRMRALETEILRNENQELRNALNLNKRDNIKTGLVIARPPQMPFDSLLLDKGERAGIKIGDRVLASENILVGYVRGLSGNTATVALNSFPETVTYGFVLRTEEAIEIVGAGGGNIRARTPIDFDIKVGDRIFVEGPGTYLAALVQVVEEDVSAGSKHILMSLPADLSKVRVVFIEPSLAEH